MTKREVKKSSGIGEVKHRPKNRKGFYMNENENLVTEEVTENAEQTAEETPEKKYTEAEFNEKVNEKVREVSGQRLARQEAKIRKRYEREYGELMELLEAGMGKKNSVGEMTDSIREAYESKGVEIAKKPIFSDKDEKVLAKAEAEEVISGGYDDVVDEVDRLAKLGVAKMTAREKEVFKILAEHRQNAEAGIELAKIGVTSDVYESDDFKDFAKMFKSDVPITKVYEQYAKTIPKKEIKTAGSMKNSNSGDNGVKDFYTPEEAKRFTQAEINKNPDLVKAIERSMSKW